MFDHGITYVRADFHLHTRKDKEFTYKGNENDFVKDYVSALQQAEIRVGIITNHNKFDLDEYKALRKRARKSGILILPGVELSVKEGSNGIHTLIIFDPDTWLANGENHIESFLSAMFMGIKNRENENTRCKYDLKQVLEHLESCAMDYYVVFAHVDQKNGLFMECNGGLIMTLSQDVNFKKRVLALQKSHTWDNSEKLKQWIGYRLPNVEGSDPKSISAIGKGEKCYLRIGESSYAAVKQALMEHENRIVYDVAPLNHGYIQSASFVGGRLDGQTLHFSPNLNTMIGIRGSGKSTILEALRYALNQEPAEDQKYKKDLVASALDSGGKIILHICDCHGKCYQIHRINNEDPVVCDESGTVLPITVNSVLRNPLYYGQKDLSQASNYEFNLLKKLVGERIQSVSDQFRDVNARIGEAIGEYLEVLSAPEQRQEQESILADVTHQITIYQDNGVDEKLKKQTDCQSDQKKLSEAVAAAQSVLNTLKRQATALQSKRPALGEYASQYNQDLLDEAAAVLKKMDDSIDGIRQTATHFAEYCQELSTVVNRLEERVKSHAEEFAAVKRELADVDINPETYMHLHDKRMEATSQIAILKQKELTKEAVENRIAQLLDERRSLLLRITEAYQEEAKKINESQSELQIDITFMGHRDGFRADMIQRLKGTKINQTQYQQLSEKYEDYAAILSDWILRGGEGLQTILRTAAYIKLEERLAADYQELLQFQTEDSVQILYHGKPLKQHSMGQRASALILFILTQDENDVLIIDQPEDDLDTKVIYDELIQTIRKRKKDLQFIFATHNANIPVLGDSEKVIAAFFEDDFIQTSQGNIDKQETQMQIVNIMEGGQEAFDRRKQIYAAWSLEKH